MRIKDFFLFQNMSLCSTSANILSFPLFLPGRLKFLKQLPLSYSTTMRLSSRMSCSNAVKTVSRRSPIIKSGMRRPLFVKNSLKKYPMIHCPKSHKKKATRDHGHNFASKRNGLPERCARHQVNGLFILVPTTPPMIPISGGKMPPPTRSIKIDSRIRTNPPAPPYRPTPRPMHIFKQLWTLPY